MLNFLALSWCDVSCSCERKGTGKWMGLREFLGCVKDGGWRLQGWGVVFMAR